jgi:hypothetical protein
MTDTAAYLQSARTWTGGLEPPSWLELEPGESLYLVTPDVDLIELRQTPLPLMGGRSDFDLAIAQRIAAEPSPARTVWINEPVSARNTGWLAVTNRRAEFFGPDLRHAWRFENLMDIAHDNGSPESWLISTNHQSVFGLRYAQAWTPHIRFCLAVALADARGTRAALVSSLQGQSVGGSAGAQAWNVTKLVYTGKPGVRPALRATQGVAAGLITLMLLAALLPGGSGDKVNTSSGKQQVTTESLPTASTEELAQQAADAQAAAEREAAARVAAGKAAAAKAAAAKAAAARAAAAKAAALREAAARAAAKKAAEQRAAQDAAAAAAQQQAASNCTPEYHDFCIPALPGDAYNCSDFTENDFTALPPDPYGLDRDNDGIACES